MSLNNITFEDYSDSSDIVINPLNTEIKRRKRKRIVTRKRRNRQHSFEFDVPCSDDESVHLPNPEIAPIPRKKENEIPKNENEENSLHKNDDEKDENGEKESTNTGNSNENEVSQNTASRDTENSSMNDQNDDDKWLEEEDLETDLSKAEIKTLRSTIRRLSDKPITHCLIPYVFKRETKITWKGKRINYQFNRGETPLFHAKMK